MPLGLGQKKARRIGAKPHTLGKKENVIVRPPDGIRVVADETVEPGRKSMILDFRR